MFPKAIDFDAFSEHSSVIEPILEAYLFLKNLSLKW